MKEGALNESLSKHIIPAITYHKNKKELHILDICFGLGYNTLATLHYIQKNNLDIKINIYSPEFDLNLIKSLQDFQYPNEFKNLKDIINSLSQNMKYKSKNINIYIYNGDARIYLKELYKKNIAFDVIYQDAFSSDVNRFLWSVEYFHDLSKLCKEKSILTTYSIATPIRLSIYKNSFFIYEYKPTNSNRITIALTEQEQIENFKYVDMELKQKRNPSAKAIYD